MENREKIIFICSAGRSGSTLLRNILDLHPYVSVVPELRFFDMALSTWKRYHNLETKKDRLLFANNVINKFKKSKDPLWQKINFDEKELVDKISRYDNLESIYLEILKTCGSKKEANIFVDKIGTFFISNIVKIFPQAVFIHALRDGCEFCASAHKRGDWADSYLNIAEYWNESIKSYDYYSKMYSSGKNFYEIKYENLVADTKEEINKLFSLLGLELENDFYAKINNLKSSSSFTKNKNKSGVFVSKNFNEYFTAKEQSAINFLLKKELKNKGYEAVSGKINILNLCKAKLHRIKLKLHFWSKRKGVFHYFYKFKKIYG